MPAESDFTIRLADGRSVLVDEVDYLRLKDMKWRGVKKRSLWYAVTTPSGTNKTISMHRLILNAAEGIEVDHRNHDGLDNRRSNLREATRQQNMRKLNPAEGDTQRFNCDDLEAWLASTGDAPAVIEYLAAKFMDSDEARQRRVLAKVEALLPELLNAVQVLRGPAT